MHLTLGHNSSTLEAYLDKLSGLLNLSYSSGLKESLSSLVSMFYALQCIVDMTGRIKYAT